MLPIVPAIPRSLEKTKFRDDLKSSKDGGGTGSPIRPASLEGKEELPVDTGAAQTQAVQNGALNGLDAKDYVQENVVHEAVVEATENVGSEKGIATAEGKSAFQGTASEQTNKNRQLYQQKAAISPQFMPMTSESRSVDFACPLPSI